MACPTFPNLKLSVRSESEVELSWDGFGDGYTYQVQYKSDVGDWITYTESSSVSEVTVYGLQSDTSYFFRVRATGDCGTTEYSQVAHRKTFVAFPTISSTFIAPARQEPGYYTCESTDSGYVHTSQPMSFDLSHPNAVGLKVKGDKHFQGIVIVHSANDSITVEDQSDVVRIQMPTRYVMYVNGPLSRSELTTTIDRNPVKIANASKTKLLVCGHTVHNLDKGSGTLQISNINDTITIAKLFSLKSMDHTGACSLRFSHIPIGFGWAYINGISVHNGQDQASAVSVSEPTGMTAVQSGTSISIAWTEVANFIKLERKINRNEWETIAVMQENTKKFTDRCVITDAVYCYKISSLGGVPIDRACVLVK